MEYKRGMKPTKRLVIFGFEKTESAVYKKLLTELF